MIYNITNSSYKVDNQVNELLGPPYGIIDRFRLGGIGSPKMIINMASTDIAELLDDTPGLKFCNIELRRYGILVGFQSNMRILCWPIPFYELVLYHNKSLLSLYSNSSHLKIKPFFNKDIDLKFIRKLLELKAEYLNERSPF